MKCLFCCCCTRSKKRKDKQINNDLTKDTPFRNNIIEELKNRIDNQESETVSATNMIPESQRGTPHPPAPPLLSEEGLIIPRKLHNPVLDNADRQNLHKELLFNQKIGKNVLNQKSELQRALEKHKTNIAKREFENNMNSKTPELEKVIADRAKRLQDVSPQVQDDKSLSKEFLQARAKLKARTDSK